MLSANQQTTNRASRWIKWSQKGGMAILDQAFFAGANFVSNIVLARWMNPNDYGAFVTMFAIFLLVASLHSALLIEPMLVFGSDKYKEQFNRYLSILIRGHWVVTIFISLLLAVGALFIDLLGSPNLAHAVAGLAIGFPLILFLWLTRRAFYVRSQPEWAATGGALYLGIMLAGMYALSIMDMLTSFSAFVMMGICSFFVAIWFVILHQPQWKDDGILTYKMVFDSHWEYGRWAMPTNVATNLGNTGFYILVSVMAGLATSAALRALMNLVQPLIQVGMAIGTLLIPIFVSAYNTGGVKKLNEQLYKILAISFCISTTFFIVLVVAGSTIVDLLYKNRYSDYSSTTVFLLIGSFPLFAVSVTILSSALRASGFIRSIFWAQSISTLIAILLTAPLIYYSESIIAPLIGLNLSYALAVVILWWMHYVRVD